MSQPEHLIEGSSVWFKLPFIAVSCSLNSSVRLSRTLTNRFSKVCDIVLNYQKHMSWADFPQIKHVISDGLDVHPSYHLPSTPTLAALCTKSSGNQTSGNKLKEGPTVKLMGCVWLADWGFLF